MRIIFSLYKSQYFLYHIIMITEKLHIDRIDFALMFKNLEVAKTRIIYKLINKERNKELLEKVPHVEYLDLAIVFYYLFPSDNEDEFKGFMLNNEHMLMLDLSVTDLMNAASVNTQRILGLKFQGIFSTIAEITGAEDMYDAAAIEDGFIPLQVLSNQLGTYGASAILYKDVIKDIAERMKSNLFIIPCSIHEVLIYREMKNCQIGIDDLKEMISMVNQNEVPEEDILSDSLYYYSLENNAICII